jgi:C4-type Zn-finger protein
MAVDRECPYCGGTMRLRPFVRTDRIPGRPETVSKPIFEWICPDCDYFEEIEQETETQ